MRFLVFGLAICASSQLFAQAPSSLSYPTPNVFIANVSSVFLSPNLAGNASSYSINPILPAGLSFNTNTGVISGVPTAASPSTSYTVTANGTGGTTTTFLENIQVTNNYFDNSYAAISFGGSGVTVINGSTGAAITNTTTSTAGTAAGDIVVYQNVATLSGQAIDCIVKTVSISTNSSFTAYDEDAASGSNFSSNDPKFFSPQVTFPAGTSTGGGGSIQFSFQFILGGTYSTTTHVGLPVVLQNVKINTYDIDGSGQNFSNQYNEFGGFATSEVGSATTLNPPSYNTTTGLTTYKSSISTNSTVVTADPTRARITYNNMSDFSIRVGGGGTSYFFVDFSAGPTFSTAVATSAPSIDLNTDVIGVNNAASGCGTSLSFTPSAQTNIAAPGALTQMSVSFPTTDITNGASEQLVVTGATNGTVALNANPAITNLTLGGVIYSVSGTVSGTTRTLVFTRNTGTFTVANAEALLDSLKYSNTSTAPISGSRNFTVNVLNSAFQSPNAIFTATLDCVSIGGNVFHDINGMVDSTVNATGTSQFTAGSLYVVRTSPSNNHVIDVQPIAAGGSYSFGTVTPGAYGLTVSTTSPTVGNTFTTATFPTNYVATGENLGATAGTDHLTDGKLLITVGSESVTDANFGLQVPPTTANNTISSIPNPGGFNDYVLPANTFTVADVDGKVDSIVINSFPTGANYLKIGSTVYTNGGSCPPQVSTCTAWPGHVVVPFTAGNPTPAVSVDPATEGTATVVINFTAYDDARALSDTSNVTLNFVGTNYTTISGKVWHDGNGNGLVDGTEAFVNTADASQTLYALLIQNSHTYSGAATIFMSTPISATTGYTFSNVPTGSDYSLEIISLASAPTSGAALTTVTNHLAPNWTGVSTNANGTAHSGLNTNNPTITLTNLTASQANENFGIEMLPQANDASTIVPYPGVGTLYTLNGVGSNPPIPTATDAEDGTEAAGKTIIITSLPQFTTLQYNGTNVTLNQVITSFNPSLLKDLVTISAVGQTGTSFTFTYKDSAGVQDLTPATYTLNWQTPLPVMMGDFTATADNGKTAIDWSTFTEAHCKGFAIERSIDGRNWKQIDFIASEAKDGTSEAKLDYSAYDNNPFSGVNFYRLKQTDINNNFIYTDVRKVVFGKANTIHVYPNPATDMLNVSVADWSTITAVRILDISGKVMFQAKDASNGINMSKMANGTYLLQVEYTNGEVTDFKVAKH
jgi:hypothetical protein